MYGGLLFVRVVVTIVPLQQGYAIPIVSSEVLCMVGCCLLGSL